MQDGDEDDEGMDMGDDLGGGGAGTVDVQEFMDALESALEDVLGEPVTVDDIEIGSTSETVTLSGTELLKSSQNLKLKPFSND